MLIGTVPDFVPFRCERCGGVVESNIEDCPLGDEVPGNGTESHVRPDNVRTFAERWFAEREIDVYIGVIQWSATKEEFRVEDSYFDCDVPTVCDMIDDWRATRGLGPMERPKVIQSVALVTEAIRTRRFHA